MVFPVAVPFLFLAMAMVGNRASAADQPAAGDAALAQRIWEMADPLMRSGFREDVEQAEALLQGAHRADPDDARYLQMLVDLRTRLDDVPGRILALNGLRKLRPADLTAQLETVRIYARQMETTDLMLRYLSPLTGNEALPAELRSVIALDVALLHSERKEQTQAKRMVDRAVQINPLNLAALKMQYDLLPGNAPVADRIRLLLAMLRSSPIQPDIMVGVASQLAQQGMVAESMFWYEQTSQRYQLGPVDVLDYIAQLLIADRPEQAQKVSDAALTPDLDVHEVLMVRAAIQRRLGNAQAAEAYRRMARNDLLNRLAVVRKALGVVGAATRPVDGDLGPIPELAGDVEPFRRAEHPGAKAEYVGLVGLLGWSDAFYTGAAVRPDVERLARHLESLPDSPGNAKEVAARLAGWAFLLADKKAEAKVKLSAVADRDWMAALGLLRAQDDARVKKETADQLLARQPRGLEGALIWEDVRAMGIKTAVPTGKDAPAIRAALDAFPAKLLDIALQPERFYVVRGEPQRVSHAIGEPIWARLTLRNISDYDLTIGGDGAIQPELWIEMQPRGMFANRRGDMWRERVTEQWILRPHQAVSIMVRLDQGDVARVLSDNPLHSVPMAGAVLANFNPRLGRLGYAGQVSELSRLMERAGLAPLEQGVAKAISGMASAEPPVRMRSIEQLGIASRLLRQAGGAEKRHAELLGRVAGLRTDPDPAVTAWAAWVMAVYGPEGDARQQIEPMLGGADWRMRLMGLAAAARVLPADARKSVCEKTLQTETDRVVKGYAAAMSRATARPAAASPATQPATRPATER